MGVMLVYSIRAENEKIKICFEDLLSSHLLILSSKPLVKCD